MVASTQIAREAPFLEDYRRRLMDSVFAAGDKPIMPEGRTIADFDEFQQLGFGLGAGQLGYTIDPTTGKLIKTGQASFDPYMQQGLAAMQQGYGTMGQGLAGLQQGQQTTALGIPALQQAQAQYDPSTSNYQQFFNQYQADVTKDALKQMDDEAAKAQNQLSAQAQQAGAFGGSRFGVQEAELAKNLQDIKSQRIFSDLSSNYMQAQGNAMNTFEQAQARNLGSGQALGQMGGMQGQLGTSYGQMGQGQAGLGQGIAGLGQLQFGLGQQGLGSLMGIGTQRQTRDQALADEQLRLTTAKQQEPFGRLSYMGDMLSRQPSIQQKYIQQPMPYTNPILGGVGAGIAGLGTFGSIFGSEN